MRTPAWEDGTLLYRPAPYRLGPTYRMLANGDQSIMSWASPAPWVIAGASSSIGSGSIDDFRRQARAAAAASGSRALGQEYSDVQAIGFLQWAGKSWVTPFPSLDRARAYFDRARSIGIDYDYAAYFDVSDPQRPILAWERIGSPSLVAGATHPRSHTQSDLRYDTSDAGEPMSYPLIGRFGGRHGGGFGGGGHGIPMGHGHHHSQGRRFLEGGDGGWDQGAPYYDYAAYSSYPYPYPYPVPAYDPQADTMVESQAYGDPQADPQAYGDDGVADVSSSGHYLRNPGGPLVQAHDDLRGAADVLAPGANGLSCQVNLGSDMILRAQICVDGQCHQGAADMSRLFADIHNTLHGWDVTEEIVGRGRNSRRRHRRHRRHRQQEQQEQEQEQEQESRGQGFQGYPQPPYPYPYPYPPQTPPVAPVQPLVIQTPISPAPAGDHQHHRESAAALDDASAAQAAQKQAVKASGEILIGVLYDQHCQEISAGWLDSIGDAFTQGWHAVTRTIQKFKGPITVAATAVAASYGGPSGGQIASQLAPSVIDAAAGSGDKKKQAQQVVAIAEEAAKTQPKIAAALSAAQTAAAQTAAAYHVTSTALDALRGDSEAMRKVDQLRQDAASGDPAAQRALELVTLALQSMRSPDQAPAVGGFGLLPLLGLGAGAAGMYWWQRHRAQVQEAAARAAQKAAQAGPPAGPAGQGSATTTSGEIEHAKADAIAAAQSLFDFAREKHNSSVYFGYLKHREANQPSHARITVYDTYDAMAFPTEAEMWAWYRENTADPAGYEFVALFDATKPQWPRPILAHEPPPPSRAQGIQGY